ncbi:response regulator transcription factor [Streptomyces sp. H51]|uniref:helix-turn-helix transcriptional regulator n=1 Tax=Streptomyces sp. H51 TaxID=3111770 RepID=UPI002D79C624|nr:response regulator transcription factor [Streptomyces sp. H51]
MKTVLAAVHAEEPLTETALKACLARSPQIALTALGEAAVVVVGVQRVDASALELLSGLPSPAQARFVLVADGGWYAEPAAVVRQRVRAVLWRAEVDAAKLVRAVRAAALGQAYLPATVQGTLLDQLEHIQREVLGPRGLTASGLSHRDLEVLRLASAGMTLPEIAAELNYSERTIKNVLTSVQLRLGMRNRVHTVAHAIRAGLI